MSSNSREESPDWLRSFQAPVTSTLTLSSDSKSLSDDSGDTDFKLNTSKKKLLLDSRSSKSKKTVTHEEELNDSSDGEVTIKKHMETKTLKNRSVWTLSSDSESCSKGSPIRENYKPPCKLGKSHDDMVVPGRDGSPSTRVSKAKPSRKNLGLEDVIAKKENDTKIDVKTEGTNDLKTTEEDTSEKAKEPRISTSRLPMVLPEKVLRTKVLAECEGESIDLSGDMGAVGRILASDNCLGDPEIFLDLKGTIYKTTIVPSRTFCVVSFGQSEAKVEAIMSDFIQLKPRSNVYEAETMIEGTMEGFSFESEDEADKTVKAANQTEQTNEKIKGKAEKTSGTRKRGKATTGKQQVAKKAKKKNVLPKKAKSKK